jgi:predicted small metal-binding protein
MTPINEGPSRIAYCECGAQFEGDSEQELFDAAQQHLAHHHPQLLGTLGLEVVQQMTEERPGAISA